ncbi:uncharacterized protein TNCV_3087341 [Trichonephila clavipes]|uniref:Peptidase aspartic putative domain-containing protein n=1 Tax=Trichonephila clavipes TaxID=2585209 RepID=A0A8X6RH32_TRICX|nr:uncharacterized protein TNCV_3087341 [Trichonephila clavipes]
MREVIRNLETLDLETNSLTELIIINFLISKVDACISQRWELSLENNKIPTLEEFRVFIEREARGLNKLKFVKPDIKKVSPSADTHANSVVTVSNNCTQSAEGHVMLSTALINVKSKHGEQITCRALIDNASQNSLISKQCADRLKLPLKKHTNHKLVGVNETFAETSLYSTNFEFSSCVSSDKFQVKALLVSKVTSAMPKFPIKYHEWPNIKDLTLADPTFYIENEIDILLGADVFMTLISGTPIMGPKGTPSALPTNLAGADSLDSTRKIVHELKNLMSAGGFELRKWSCTHPEVLSDLPNTLKTNMSSLSFDDESTQKILGLFWDLNEDSFKVRTVLSDQVSTKRQMLSIIARISDPLGFVSPSTIILKIILQDLWKAGLDWDDEISSDILNRWNRFQAEISCLKQIKVPRVNFHAGQELVLSLIRQQFWIPHGKSAVKKELRNCIDCFKLVAKPVSQMMGDLPIERINP